MPYIIEPYGSVPIGLKCLSNGSCLALSNMGISYTLRSDALYIFMTARCE